MIASAILGAGFSSVAGLPLTKDLFDELPIAKSKRAQREYQEVLTAWSWWKENNPDGNAELWLRSLYDNRWFSTLGTTWENALDFAMARLVKIGVGTKAAYFHGICTSSDNEIHKTFWKTLRKKFVLKQVITMNYDILAEQGLRDEYTKERRPPICYYGGFPYQQVVKKVKNPATHDYENVELGHEITLFKMHGSINWADEPHGFKIHDDVRAAFRVERKRGSVAIIPPLPGKEIPSWLESVWKQAEEALASSQVWIVCGYSLPDYDEALKEFFKRAAHKTSSLRIYILDPGSEQLVQRWKNITPFTTNIRGLPGLPIGLEEKYWTR